MTASFYNDLQGGLYYEHWCGMKQGIRATNPLTEFDNSGYVQIVGGRREHSPGRNLSKLWALIKCPVKTTLICFTVDRMLWILLEPSSHKKGRVRQCGQVTCVFLSFPTHWTLWLPRLLLPFNHTKGTHRQSQSPRFVKSVGHRLRNPLICLDMQRLT